MNFPFLVVIPCRYGSRRLRGKALMDLGGITLIQHVYNAARNSQADRVIIATDDERIEDVARSFGAEVIMTASDHRSGTDRIMEVCRRIQSRDDMIVVNVQGDEYDLPPGLIDQVAGVLFANPGKQMATLCEKISAVGDAADPDIVKVVRDINDNAIYFSRAAIPWQENKSESGEYSSPVYRHIGLYAYRVAFLRTFSNLQVPPLERAERLEQLRALYNGYSIHVEPACEHSGLGIDTLEDLQRARQRHNHKQQA